jgi:phosphoserine phosphatase
MSTNHNTWRAVHRVKDRMSAGARQLMQMHTAHGKKWFVVPGGPEVNEDIAMRVIAEPDVHPNNDGLFPGVPQTYRLGVPKQEAAE